MSKNIVIQDSSYLKKDSSIFLFLNNNQFIFEIDSSTCLFYNFDYSSLIVFHVLLFNDNEIKIAHTNMNFNLLGFDFSDSNISHEYLIQLNYQKGTFFIYTSKGKKM